MSKTQQEQAAKIDANIQYLKQKTFLLTNQNKNRRQLNS